MALVTHPIFGAIDLSKTGMFDADVTFGGRLISVDLNLEDQNIPPSVLQELPQSPDDLEPFDRSARAAILADAQSGSAESAAVLYLTHHHDALSPQTYQRLFGAIAPDLANPQPLLSRLALVRVGFYLETNNRRTLLDYSIDRDTTDYLLCVAFDSNGKTIAVDMES